VTEGPTSFDLTGHTRSLLGATRPERWSGGPGGIYANIGLNLFSEQNSSFIVHRLQNSA